jgi:alkylation response protein AidB-like acyl-CoA dehydrogenase
MRMQPSTDQRELIDSVAGPVAEILPIARLHEGADGEAARLGALAELGALAIALGEEQGGAGLTATEEALLFEQLGRQLASPAVLASALAAHIAAANGDADRAGSIATGSAPVAIAVPAQVGDGVLLIDAVESPAHVLLLGADGPVLFGASALSDRALLDADQWSLPLETAKLGGGGARGDAGLAIRAKLLCAAQLAGIAGSARDMGVEYAKLREQFGKPIGSFQATKHNCSNMAMWAMAAADQMSFAAVAVAEGRDDAAFQALAALSMGIRAAKANAGTNIQIHGGIGFSDECDAHLLVKAAHLWETIAGGEEAVHAALLAEASPLGSAKARH